MHALSVLLASTLVAASPLVHPVKRSAAVIPLPARDVPSNGNKRVFNAEHARIELLALERKYPMDRFLNFTEAQGPGTEKRSENGKGARIFDIQKRATSGKVALTNVFDDVDLMYHGPLQIGTPAQACPVIFDTGSSDLWLAVSTCSGCANAKFWPSFSRSFRSTDTPFTVRYNDGSIVAGKVASESVSVAGLNIPDQSFGAVTEATGRIARGPAAGVMGLGFPAKAKSNATPFFIALAKAHKLASNVFSFYMSRGGSQGSELCIGCTNSAKYTGQVEFYKLDSQTTGGVQYYWNIPSGGFTYKNGPASGSFSAVIDSGTTLIYVPSAIAEKFYSQIPGTSPAPSNIGDGFYQYPCDATLGTIALKFGTSSYALNPQDFNVGAVAEGSDMCVGGIVGQDFKGVDLAIIGDEFMKNWYSVFDYDNMAVGFAKAI